MDEEAIRRLVAGMHFRADRQIEDGMKLHAEADQIAALLMPLAPEGDGVEQLIPKFGVTLGIAENR